MSTIVRIRPIFQNYHQSNVNDLSIIQLPFLPDPILNSLKLIKIKNENQINLLMIDYLILIFQTFYPF